MKAKILISFAVLVAATLGETPGTASAQDVLTGDTRLACEAILCLASGTRPSECQPSLRRFFSISARKLKNTIKKRGNFLKLCPTSNQTPEMSQLVNAMTNGAGRCDVQSLNRTLRSWSGFDSDNMYISNRMPTFCSAYTNHAYTDFAGTIPRYVGTPDSGGHWVEASDYDRAQAEYEARIAAEDARSRYNWLNN